MEQRMEEMLGEVEQMERVNLLQSGEVKELLKKRKHFEYKIQKQTKEKGDFLAYIQYESNVLSLLALRRESTGYQHKKAEIEGGIKVRINKLFKILEHRFQSDVTVWLQHLAFLKTAQWEASVSRIYLRMLQVHSSKPGLWVAAAQWEFETLGNADNGRALLLRGLRFLPKSWTLRREYLRLELLYVEQLRKRQEVLVGEKTEQGLEDGVLGCAVVQLVAKDAVENINSPEFVVSILVLLRTFPFASEVEEELVKWLGEEQPDHPVTVDTLARRDLAGESKSYKERLAACVERYTEGVRKTGDGKLVAFAISTLQELLEQEPKQQKRLMSALLQLLRLGQDKRLLLEEHYTFWLSCLDYSVVPDVLKEVATAGVEAHPKSAVLWVERLAVAKREDLELEVFKKAVTALKGEEEAVVRVWEVMLELQGPEQGWSLVQGSLLDRGSPGLRLLHLTQAGCRGLSAAREVYETNKLLPPFSRSIHYSMAALEQEEDRPSVAHLRHILDTLCDQFGATDPLPWVARVRLEQEAGKPLEAAKLVCRAEGCLQGKELVAKFALLREKEGV